MGGVVLGGQVTRAITQGRALISLFIFLVAWCVLTPWENHGLWAALYVSYIARISTLGFFYPALVRSVPA